MISFGETLAKSTPIPILPGGSIGAMQQAMHIPQRTLDNKIAQQLVEAPIPAG